MVEVTDADREAAWLYRPAVSPRLNRDDWLAGLYDDGIEVIQAFARHRIAAEQRGKLEGARLALEAAYKVADGWFKVDLDERSNCMAGNIRIDIRALSPAKIVGEG